MEREVLTAREGYVYTNGKDFGEVVYLGSTDSAGNWTQVPVEEAAEAAEADYQEALAGFGVSV